MQSMTIKDTYPIQATTLLKDESRFGSTNEIVIHLENLIEISSCSHVYSHI